MNVVISHVSCISLELLDLEAKDKQGSKTPEYCEHSKKNHALNVAKVESKYAQKVFRIDIDTVPLSLADRFIAVPDWREVLDPVQVDRHS